MEWGCPCRGWLGGFWRLAKVGGWVLRDHGKWMRLYVHRIGLWIFCDQSSGWILNRAVAWYSAEQLG